MRGLMDIVAQVALVLTGMYMMLVGMAGCGSGIADTTLLVIGSFF